MEPVCRQVVFVKIDRIAAWILLFSMIGFFVSGFVMTKGVGGTGAVTLHNSFLPFVGGLSLLVHTFFAIRLAFMRWKIKTSLSMALLSSLYGLLFFGLLYGMFFLSPASYSTSTEAPQGKTQQSTRTTQSEQKIFSASELSQYDGKDGNPSYVAVDGVVYDLSSVFKNGIHFGHVAGKDLTDAFYVKHVRSQITKYPVVGVLK